ncbi:ABC transporter substrate-binding protein [Aestuariivirga sp.]|uniref:ABC transporter substrate-binding protein n=1 Tax=Aestuariivirga sp. TaxID=2650926 RepID=UPI0039E6C08A
MRAHLRIAVVAVSLLFGAAAADAATCPAEPFVKSAGAVLMRAARSNSPASFSGMVQRYADVRGLAFFALGPYRGKLPKAQEGEYVSLTLSFIGRFMANHAGRFNGNGLTVISCTGDGANMTVTAKLSGGQKVIFRLSRTRGGFKVRDLNVSSIWLAQQLRSNFVGTLKRADGDLGALFRYLKTYS